MERKGRGYAADTMQQPGTRSVLAFEFAIVAAMPMYAQNKMACELISKVDAEAILGVSFQRPGYR
jgi:hypothetical protein